jgi:peroxiredoxin
MKPRFNWPLLAGFVLSVATLLSFRLVFVKWPLTRDVPWANLLLAAAAVACLWIGVRRAYAPGRLRVLRATIGSIVAILSATTLALFAFMVLIVPRQLPAAAHAPAVGERVPDLALLDMNGAPVSLDDVLAGRVSSDGVIAQGPAHAPKGVALIFYMYSECSACNSELHDMQSYVRAFADAGIVPIAISCDMPDTTKRLRGEAGYTFAFLSDPQSETIRRFDLLNPDGKTARPADFLIDATGTVRWRMVTGDYYVRARPSQILAAATEPREPNSN